MAAKMSFFRLVACVALCEGAGLLGSIFTMQSITTWYAGLEKPWFTPPSWLFGPAWTTLYAMMGLSLFIVWNHHLEYGRSGNAISLFCVQLALNILWSYLFFGLRLPFIAFVDILILWTTILFMVFSSWKLSRIAAFLFVPYLAWVSFASLLNFYIWKLN